MTYNLKMHHEIAPTDTYTMSIMVLHKQLSQYGNKDLV